MAIEGVPLSRTEALRQGADRVCAQPGRNSGGLRSLPASGPKNCQTELWALFGSSMTHDTSRINVRRCASSRNDNGARKINTLARLAWAKTIRINRQNQLAADNQNDNIRFS